MRRMLPTRQFLVQGESTETAMSSGDGDTTILISLTFDDGPDPQWTPPVLDALDEADWTGTFFLIGRKAEAHPDLVREIVERGHEIGNHSYAHREPDEIGAREFAHGVIQTQDLLTRMAGRQVTLMRPPKGRLDLHKTCALWKSGQSVVLWNVDPRDYRMSCLETARCWARNYDPSNGDIVLLHDRLPYASEIVSTLASLRPHQRRFGIRSVGISNWLTGYFAGVLDFADLVLCNPAML